jgi:hypothetical protein
MTLQKESPKKILNKLIIILLELSFLLFCNFASEKFKAKNKSYNDFLKFTNDK